MPSESPIPPSSLPGRPAASDIPDTKPATVTPPDSTDRPSRASVALGYNVTGKPRAWGIVAPSQVSQGTQSVAPPPENTAAQGKHRRQVTIDNNLDAKPSAVSTDGASEEGMVLPENKDTMRQRERGTHRRSRFRPVHTDRTDNQIQSGRPQVLSTGIVHDNSQRIIVVEKSIENKGNPAVEFEITEHVDVPDSIMDAARRSIELTWIRNMPGSTSVKLVFEPQVFDPNTGQVLKDTPAIYNNATDSLHLGVNSIVELSQQKEARLSGLNVASLTELYAGHEIWHRVQAYKGDPAPASIHMSETEYANSTKEQEAWEEALHVVKHFHPDLSFSMSIGHRQYDIPRISRYDNRPNHLSEESMAKLSKLGITREDMKDRALLVVGHVQGELRPPYINEGHQQRADSIIGDISSSSHVTILNEALSFPEDINPRELFVQSKVVEVMGGMTDFGVAAAVESIAKEGKYAYVDSRKLLSSNGDNISDQQLGELLSKVVGDYGVQHLKLDEHASLYIDPTAQSRRSLQEGIIVLEQGVVAQITPNEERLQADINERVLEEQMRDLVLQYIPALQILNTGVVAGKYDEKAVFISTEMRLRNLLRRKSKIARTIEWDHNRGDFHLQSYLMLNGGPMTDIDLEVGIRSRDRRYESPLNRPRLEVHERTGSNTTVQLKWKTGKSAEMLQGFFVEHPELVNMIALTDSLGEKGKESDYEIKLIVSQSKPSYTVTLILSQEDPITLEQQQKEAELKENIKRAKRSKDLIQAGATAARYYDAAAIAVADADISKYEQELHASRGARSHTVAYIFNPGKNRFEGAVENTSIQPEPIKVTNLIEISKALLSVITTDSVAPLPGKDTPVTIIALPEMPQWRDEDE